VPRLQSEERHGQHRLGRKATHGTSRAIQSARYIDGNHTPGRTQRVSDDAVHVARQAGTEYGVDNQLGACRLPRVEWCGWTTPMRSGIGRVRSGARWSQRSQRNRPAFLLQQPRRDVAVAAIVAKPRQHKRTARAEPLLDGTRHRAPGIRHKRRARNAKRRRGRIGTRHLLRPQQLGSSCERTQPIGIECHALTLRGLSADLKGSNRRVA
jgi:hypothetical protein